MSVVGLRGIGFSFLNGLQLPGSVLFTTCARNVSNNLGNCRVAFKVGIQCAIKVGMRGQAVQPDSEFRKYGVPVDLVQKLNGKEVCSAYNAVRRGEIWNDPIREPEYFILKLKKNAGHLDFRARIAAILSLWHTAGVIE